MASSPVASSPVASSHVALSPGPQVPFPQVPWPQVSWLGSFKFLTSCFIFPGENEHEQIACFLEVLGSPPASLLERSQRRRIFFDSRSDPRQMINSRGRRRKIHGKTLEKATTSNDPVFLDFIASCLTWEPNHRLTPMQAIRHEWISRNKSKKSSSPKRDSGLGGEIT